MDAHAALYPTEQSLSSFALGKLDDASSGTETSTTAQTVAARTGTVLARACQKGRARGSKDGHGVTKGV